MSFSFLKSNLYTKESLTKTINAFNKLNNMLPDEQSEIENIINIATSWWVDNLSSYTFDSGIEGQLGKNLNIIAEMFANNTSISKEKQIQKFKEILGSRIRILLLSQHICVLNVDYRPEGELAIAVNESKIKASFPVKTRMTITNDKIEVQKSYSSPTEVIYSKERNTDLKK